MTKMISIKNQIPSSKPASRQSTPPGGSSIYRHSLLHNNLNTASSLLGRRLRGRQITGRPAEKNRTICLATREESIGVPAKSVSVVLLAGGIGKRMGAKIPKQFLELNGRAIATYSLEIFAKMKETLEVVIVCDPSWRYVFEESIENLGLDVPIKWALPGRRERQDSVFNGFQEISSEAMLVSIHDSVRPLVLASDVERCLEDGLKVGAAVLGVRVKPTIKEVDSDLTVIQTLERSKLWEVQTPQVIKPELLAKGFDYIKKNEIEVTDDVSIIEALGLPVKITEGSYTNIKLTTPDDLSVAERLLNKD